MLHSDRSPSLHRFRDSIPDSNGPHNGGALRFGPDGKLYLSLGDDFDWCPAQDSTSLLGKVLRLNVSQLPPGPGGPPVRQRLAPFDNPWAWSADRNERLIYAKGFRNPFRFQIDRETGLLYVADVGDVSWEELDEVRAGDDAGWPFREGPTAFAAPPSCGPPGVGYLDPIDAYDHDEGAVILSAGVIRRKPGSLWPEEWEGNVLYADFENGFVRMLHYDGTKWERVPVAGVSDSRYLFSELYFVTDFQWGPDGSLWWLQFTRHRHRRRITPGRIGKKHGAHCGRHLCHGLHQRAGR